MDHPANTSVPSVSVPGDRPSPSPPGSHPSPRSPLTIGLALGGGVARGWAHIGILRAFMAAGIEPDYVVGTSIGAVVGGCYCAGKLDEIEAFARSLTRTRMFRLMDFSFTGSGLLAGDRLLRLLDEALAEYTIESLERDFICVATELGTGHEAWLSSGAMAPAIRASFAVPGVFTPVELGGRWLIDGAVVNPVPVSVCRAKGARLVLAVRLDADIINGATVVEPFEAEAGDEEDINSDDGETTSARTMVLRQLFGARKGRPGMSQVMVDVINITQDRITRSRLAGDPPDLFIAPRLGHIGMFDFHLAKEMISIGYETTSRAIEDIQQLMAFYA